MRFPAVSGLFYPSDRDELLSMLKGFEAKAKYTKNYKMVIAPHAGYIYSGFTAMHSYLNLEIKDKVVIIGPNHYGIGAPLSTSYEDWTTPLGKVKIAKELIPLLDIPIDENAHLKEHSIEVQLPFLQYFKQDFSFLPISIKEQNIDNAYLLAKRLKDIDATFVFSSDFSHYVPSTVAKQEDNLAIQLIKEKKVEEFYETFFTRNWSICGFAGVMVFMILAKNLAIDLIHYSTSGDVNGDYNNVVGYASIGAF